MAGAPEHSQSNPAIAAVRLGRYALFGEIARGGMATVHFGRLLGSVGFSRTVAIKRLHPQFAADHEFVSMFVDEARLAARIQHPNVISTLDVIAEGNELALVMDFVQGASLARLIHASAQLQSRVPMRVISAVMLGVLAGLHAAHEAKNERGEPLGIVHRDMSPQNVLVGADGVARVFDFGIAKATGRLSTTREGQFKGKISYAAPEQLGNGQSDRRTDVYSASVILWELLTQKRAFRGDDPLHVLKQVIQGEISRPSEHVEGIPPELEAVVMQGLSKDPDDRFATAEQMALALERAEPYASPREVAEWVAAVAGDELRSRAKAIEEIELSSQTLISPSDVPTLVRQAQREVEAYEEVDASELIERTSAGVPSAKAARVSTATGVGTLAIPAPDGGSRRGLGAWIAFGAIALVVAAGGVVVWVQTRPMLSADTFTRRAPPLAAKRDIRAKVEDAPSTASASASSSPAASVARLVAPPSPRAPASASISAAPSEARPASSASVASSAAASSAATAAANCTPPYTIDEDGIRHLKPECL